MSLPAEVCEKIRAFVQTLPGVHGFALIIEKDAHVYELVSANFSLDTGAAVLAEMAADVRLSGEQRPARLN